MSTIQNRDTTEVPLTITDFFPIKGYPLLFEMIDFTVTLVLFHLIEYEKNVTLRETNCIVFSVC